jgi:predicted lipid carrier protein YhbT
MAEIHVEIVAVERELWSGEATFVFTRTTAGEIGILPRHIPLVAQLVDDAMVRVEREGEGDRDATLILSGTQFLKLVLGHLNPVTAVMKGSIKVKGDVKAALRLHNVMRIPGT